MPADKVRIREQAALSVKAIGRACARIENDGSEARERESRGIRRHGAPDDPDLGCRGCIGAGNRDAGGFYSDRGQPRPGTGQQVLTHPRSATTCFQAQFGCGAFHHHRGNHPGLQRSLRSNRGVQPA